MYGSVWFCWLDPLVTLKDIFGIVKVKILLEGTRATNFRVGEGELQHGWKQLCPILLEHNNLRRAGLKVAIRPMYIWTVSGKRGVALALEQMVATPVEPRVTIDHFL
jgi:hypothetical protein